MPKSLEVTSSVDGLIRTIRNHRVILDSDLAALYGVPTKVFNQAIKRNTDRFPDFFRFQLTKEEFDALRSHFVTSNEGRGGRRYLPFVFTEHGALMAANVLSSPRAIKMSVALIEAFIRLRQEFASTQVLARRLAEIERTVVQHDTALKELFRAIKPLLLPPPEPPRKRIGFHTDRE
jgi:hypothetical protein